MIRVGDQEINVVLTILKSGFQEDWVPSRSSSEHCLLVFSSLVKMPTLSLAHSLFFPLILKTISLLAELSRDVISPVVTLTPLSSSIKGQCD